MSVGHHQSGERGHIITDDERAFLKHLFSDPKFAAAVEAYDREDDSYAVPYLGGSSVDGRTIFFDRIFAEAAGHHQVVCAGRPFDPRPFIKRHEAVEGALIRLLGFDYDTAHRLATVAERDAVHAAGLGWSDYEAALKPWENRTEHEPDSVKLPPDLLPVAYEGSKWFSAITGQPKAAGTADQQARREHTHEVMKEDMPKFRDYDGDEPADRTAVAPGAFSPPPAMGVAPPSPNPMQGGEQSTEIAPKAPHPTFEHGRTVSAANHLHKQGHITSDQHKKITGKARSMIDSMRGGRKTTAARHPDVQPRRFGSLAPPQRGGSNPGGY